MSSLERKCITCGDTEEMARLERCVVCGRDFCSDCTHRALGRRFCTATCAKAFFYGDSDDDDQEHESPDE